MLSVRYLSAAAAVHQASTRRRRRAARIMQDMSNGRNNAAT